MSLTARLQNSLFNTLRSRQNSRNFSDDLSKCIFLKKNVWISIKISLKFVPKSPVNNIQALEYNDDNIYDNNNGDKPLSEPMMVRLLMHIYALLGLFEFKGYML